MTKQEYFDLLVKTSAGGGFPAINESGFFCMYRAHDGKKCAVGLLIPDEWYKPKMEEGGKVDRLCHYFPEVTECFPEGMSTAELLAVQNIHDDRASRGENWNHNKFVSQLRELPFFSEMAVTP